MMQARTKRGVPTLYSFSVAKGALISQTPYHPPSNFPYHTLDGLYFDEIEERYIFVASNRDLNSDNSTYLLGVSEDGINIRPLGKPFAPHPYFLNYCVMADVARELLCMFQYYPLGLYNAVTLNIDTGAVIKTVRQLESDEFPRQMVYARI